MNASPLPERRAWLLGDDGTYRPTPPYREGEVVGCEGCGRPVRVNKHAEAAQFVYPECRKCGEDYDAYVQSWGEQ